jgi:3-dehydroquinate synthase
MLHGETVAIGMVLESALAERLGVAAPGTADAVASAVRAARLPDARPAAMSPAALLEAMRLDKKVRAGRTELALPRRVGAMGGADSGWAIPVDDANLLEILR